MKRTPILAALAALAAVLASCGSAAAPTSTETPPPATSAAPTTAQTDPYDAFQSAAKATGIVIPTDLDRDSALTRALLGCGTTWPTQTLDAVLAQAYAVQIRQAQAQGHCQ